MLKERARIIAAGLWAISLALVTAAFFGAHWLRNDLLPDLGLLSERLYPVQSYLPLLPLALLIWGLLLLRPNHFRSHRRVPLYRETWEVLQSCAAAAVLFIGSIYLLRLDERLLENDKISRLWIVFFAAAACALLLAQMLGIRVISRLVRARGYNYRTILLVGTGESALAIADSLDRHRHWGYRILGFVVDREEGRQAVAGRYRLLGEIADLPEIVERNAVDEVIFAVPRQRFDELEDLLLSLEDQGVCARLALDIFPHAKARLEVGELDGIPMLTFSSVPGRPLLLAGKRLTDLSLGLLLLLLMLPLGGLIAALVKLASPGGVLYRQVRCGLNGRRFTLYKFRTMVSGAEEKLAEVAHLNEMNGPAFKSQRDPRVTGIGRLLRRFSLDELPQLWNVVKGDMSLVGPRPPLPEEVEQYERWQRRRLSMKPGLTCLWQIGGRNEIDFERWMELDLQYIDSWSPLLDLKILLRTIPAVLSGRGAS